MDSLLLFFMAMASTLLVVAVFQSQKIFTLENEVEDCKIANSVQHEDLQRLHKKHGY